jgi:hypothetical protein
VRIPDGPNGFPTLSPTQLRTYGAGGFRLEEQESERGCPRQYKAKYVERRVPHQRSDAMDYGTMIHQVMWLMEAETIGPEEALERCFPADMDPAFWTEAVNDLAAYMDRSGSPVDRMATVATEVELTALLYEDEEFGPIYMRGIIDWLGIDSEQPGVMHAVDYKTNRHPPKVEDVLGDVQLKTYDWLVRQNWTRWLSGTPQVVVHLDAIKYREIEVRFTQQEIEAWHGWAVAVARRILRDETAEPVLNPHCGWCPVRDDCPAWLGMPDTAKALLERRPANDASLQQRYEWRKVANALRILLEKSVEEIDNAIKHKALADGMVVIGDQKWERTDDWGTEIDMIALHRVLGGRFYEIVTTSKKKIEALTASMEPHEIAAVQATISTVPKGVKIQQSKIRGA